MILAKFLLAIMFVEKLVLDRSNVFGWPLTPKYVAQTLGWSIQSPDSGSNLSDSRRADAMTSGHGVTDKALPVFLSPGSTNPRKHDSYLAKLK